MKFLDFVIHFDHHLKPFIQEHGTGTYLILFLIIFAETGLVFTPILPGDSLLFAVGVFCHPEKSQLNVWLTFVLLMTAAFIGDTTNYCVGRFFGHKLFRNEKSKIFKKSHLTTTHEFFDKHGKKTIVLARFVPIVRTFAPFVAGLGKMPYPKFITYSVCGTGAWVAIFLFSGYFIGQIPAVEQHFTLALLIMLVLTASPLAWEVYKGFRENKAAKAKRPAAGTE
ncbi:MAG TPA: DedA family protein [Fimbriimonas sp.]|nr:DedA family protein [Fimbriimonas sp.]